VKANEYITLKIMSMKIVAFRLHPKQDLKAELMRCVTENHIQAGVVLACVGSLARAVVRLAGDGLVRTWEEKMEILSLNGTLSQDGVHLHVALADKNGNAFGGHLLGECLIHTTAEIVIGELDNLKFTRTVDAATGYKELVVEA
jgi:uncharacterized protein